MFVDPCLLAGAAAAVVVALLWVTLGLGSRAMAFERTLLAGFLAGMPVVYISRYFYAATSRGRVWFWTELGGVVIFGALAWLGGKRSPWFLAGGIAAHGIAWDAWHYKASTYIPDWYAVGCLAIDLALAVYVALRTQSGRLELTNSAAPGFLGKYTGFKAQ